MTSHLPMSARDDLRRLEIAARRPLDDTTAHPDACCHLTLGGVDWAIPPRGRRVTFDLSGPRPLARVTGEEWPEAPALLALLPRATLRRCRRCGQPRAADATLAGRQATEFLQAAAALAARLLMRQYDLPPHQVGELLSFPAGATPAWIQQLVAWCAAPSDPAMPHRPDR